MNYINNYNLIVALCKNNGIGKDGKLPWNIKEDMQYFTKYTKGNNNNAIIMGKNTWDSLPKKSLNGRDNFIISSKIIIDEIMPDGHRIKSFKNIDHVINFCSFIKYDNIWIIGGSTIYKEFLERNIINKCYITYINQEYLCDSFFTIDFNNWELLHTNSIITNGNINITFTEFIYKKN
jgi:dihydrofolate reductase